MGVCGCTFGANLCPHWTIAVKGINDNETDYPLPFESCIFAFVPSCKLVVVCRTEHGIRSK